MLKRLLFCTILFLACLFAQAPGTYTGTWMSRANGGAGKISLAFSASELESATFTFQDQNVKTKPISLTKDGDHVEFVFEYTLDGNVLRSTMQATVTGKALAGKYKSATADGATPVDEGTWEVTLKP